MSERSTATPIDPDRPEVLDPVTVEWPRVTRSTYVIEQELTYRYEGPIHDLRHRLVVIPRHRHGDQQRIDYRFAVQSASRSVRRAHRDAYGNLILDVEVDRVEDVIAFRTRVRLSRRPVGTSHRLSSTQVVPAYRQATTLTQPDSRMRDAARRLRAVCHDDLSLAYAINEWVYVTMRYGYGNTHVDTTASQALSAGTGVCQDYAHIMLAMCRLCGLAARYVSGHLLGEGGSHAWVEVLIADRQRTSEPVAYAFDPTHGCAAGPRHLTVAVGRDYRDVAPTSGSYRSTFGGILATRKRVGVVGVEYAA